MNLTFKPFQKEYYPEYKSWFADPELNEQLGPMDEEWLDAVLSRPAFKGVEWVVFRDGEMVAVAGIAYDPEQKYPPFITEIAIKPTLRRQGIATAVIKNILAQHDQQGITKIMTCIHIDNAASLQCFKKLGFTQTSSEPNKYGFIDFVRG